MADSIKSKGEYRHTNDMFCDWREVADPGRDKGKRATARRDRAARVITSDQLDSATNRGDE